MISELKYTDDGSDEQELKKEIEDWMQKKAGIKDSFLYVMKNASVDQIDYLMNVNEKPELYHLLRGRICKYGDEILVTETGSKGNWKRYRRCCGGRL